jgi:hypothetical protein
LLHTLILDYERCTTQPGNPNRRRAQVGIEYKQ